LYDYASGLDNLGFVPNEVRVHGQCGRDGSDEARDSDRANNIVRSWHYLARSQPHHLIDLSELQAREGLHDSQVEIVNCPCTDEILKARAAPEGRVCR
jgi:hypothetical protein